MTLLALLLAFAPGPVAADTADPLAPSLRGLVQCYGPNREKKTCVSIGAYAKDAKGVIQNTATVLMASSPQIVMTTVAPVEVKAGAVCGYIRMRDLETASFVIDGTPADATDAEAVRKAVAPAYAPFLDKEFCTVFRTDGPGLVGEVTVGGQRRRELDQRVRWVAPSEGYAVKP
jgi:hypothetical protein